MAESELLEEFRDRLKSAVDSKTEFDENAETYFNYYGGEQWEQTDKDALAEQDRPALTFNQTMAVVNAVSGSEITGRFESKFFPRTVEDQAIADAMNDTVRWVRQQGDIEHEESMAFRDAVICGVGCTEFRQSYDRNPYGDTLVEAVPIFEVYWDPYARRPNILDARYVCRGKWIPKDEAYARWPEAKDDLDSAISSGSGIIERGEGGVHDQTHQNLYQQAPNQFYNRKRDEVLVWEYQWYELERWVVFLDPSSGQMQEMSAEEFNVLRLRLDELGSDIPETVEIRKRIYYRAFICGDTILEDFKAPTQDGFTYKFITGFPLRKRDGVVWFGLMKPMMDPQNWTNKMLSQLVHIVNTNPKGAILGPRSVFEDPEDAADRWSRPNPIIFTADNADLQRDVRIEHGNYPQAQERIFQLASEAVVQVVGFNPFIVRSPADLSRVATSALRTVQNQGMVILSTLFDSLYLYRKSAGRAHLEFIRAFMPEGVIVRITQPNGMQVPTGFKRAWVEAVDYDIVVDEAPSSKSAMQELWDSLQQTQSLQLLLEMGLFTPDIVAEIIPNVPESVRVQMRQNAMNMNLMNQLLQLAAEGRNDEVIAALQQQLQPQQEMQ